MLARAPSRNATDETGSDLGFFTVMQWYEHQAHCKKALFVVPRKHNVYHHQSLQGYYIVFFLVLPFLTSLTIFLFYDFHYCMTIYEQVYLQALDLIVRRELLSDIQF